MSKAGTWGDGVTLAGAAALYRRPINVVFTTGSTVTLDSHTSQHGAEPIILGYTGQNDSLLKFHYVSLKPITTIQPSSTTNSFPASSDISPSAEPADDNSKPISTSSHSSTNVMSQTRNGNVTKKPSVCKSDKLLTKRQSEFKWLVSAEGGALCSMCADYYLAHPLPPDHSGTFVTKPFSDWKKSTGSTVKSNKLLKHAYSDSHKTAATFKRSGETMAVRARTVYSIVSMFKLMQKS